MRFGSALLVFAGALCASLIAMLIVWCWQPAQAPLLAVPSNVLALAQENRQQIGSLVAEYEQRPVKKGTAPWQLFHGLLARSGDYEIISGGTGRSCLQWLLTEASWQPLYRSTRLVTQNLSGPAFTHIDGLNFEFEDHFAQFLFVLLIECRLDPHETFVRMPPDGRSAPLIEFVRAAEKECHEYSELSWALPVLLKWGNRAGWKNRFGAAVDGDRLLAQHLQRETEACWGTHWCMGLALGIRYGQDQVTGACLRQARARLSQAIAEAHASQNEAGQFPFHWNSRLRGAAAPTDQLEAEISHQGHMLEWLMIALSDAELVREAWPHQAVAWLARAMPQKANLDYGGHSHCVHALRLYYERCKALTIAEAAGTK